MWTRRELKERAKAILRNSYWRALIVSFIIVIAGGSLISNSISNNTNRNKTTPYTTNSKIKHFQNNSWMSRMNIKIPYVDRIDKLSETSKWPFNSFANKLPGFLSFPALYLAGIVSLIIAAFVFAFRILIGYNLEVGGRRYFLLSATGDEKISNTFNNIKSIYYFNIIVTMFLRSLYTFLWSLLFVIPGIVKSYAYRMVPYILAENPEISPSEAIALSCKMTEGHKLNMFVLDISFIGWFILGSLAFGIGIYFVNPYVESTYAQLYLTLSGRKGIYVTDDYIEVHNTN